MVIETRHLFGVENWRARFSRFRDAKGTNEVTECERRSGIIPSQPKHVLHAAVILQESFDGGTACDDRNEMINRPELCGRDKTMFGGETRTHWAVKEGGIPSAMKARLIPVYDVVFSFAGEDRAYVEKVSRYLRKNGVRVFYDKDEQADLWGKDLAEHFDLVYGQSGRYCVMFISAAYVEKMGTRHERRTALARALKEHGEYILPARFDNTPVDGIRATVGYIGLQNLAPAGLGKEILKKLGRTVA